jgi:hypothetical protein
MSIERTVFLTIDGGAAACPADGSGHTPFPTDNINSVRDGVSSPTTTQQ